MTGLMDVAIGPSTHTIDTDGRLIIPTRFRDLLSHKFVLTRGVEKCLWAFPLAQFDQMVAAWRANPLAMFDQNARMLDWRFVGQAVVVAPDKQNRIVLPQELKASAGISSAIVMMGMFNRVEIWSAEQWKAQDEGLTARDVQQALNATFGFAQPSGAEGVINV